MISLLLSEPVGYCQNTAVGYCQNVSATISYPPLKQTKKLKIYPMWPREVLPTLQVGTHVLQPFDKVVHASCNTPIEGKAHFQDLLLYHLIPSGLL